MTAKGESGWPGGVLPGPLGGLLAPEDCKGQEVSLGHSTGCLPFAGSLGALGPASHPGGSNKWPTGGLSSSSAPSKISEMMEPHLPFEIWEEKMESQL